MEKRKYLLMADEKHVTISVCDVENIEDFVKYLMEDATGRNNIVYTKTETSVLARYEDGYKDGYTYVRVLTLDELANLGDGDKDFIGYTGSHIK